MDAPEKQSKYDDLGSMTRKKIFLEMKMQKLLQSFRERSEKGNLSVEMCSDEFS